MSSNFAITIMVIAIATATAFQPIAVFGFAPVFIIGMVMVIFK